MQLLFSFDRGMGVENTLMQTPASQLSSTFMQLLFSFDQGLTFMTLFDDIKTDLNHTLHILLLPKKVNLRSGNLLVIFSLCHFLRQVVTEIALLMPAFASFKLKFIK
jgi:hypothetical protein